MRSPQPEVTGHLWPFAGVNVNHRNSAGNGHRRHVQLFEYDRTSFCHSALHATANAPRWVATAPNQVPCRGTSLCASCSSRHWIFPVADFGSASTNSITRGTL